MGSNLQSFSFQDLDDIMVGAHFYACGGGGALENGSQLIDEAKKALEKRGCEYISYWAPSDVPDDAWLPVLGAMGAPQKFLQYGYGKSPVSAFLAHERLIQIRLGNPSLSFCSMIAAESGTIAHGMALLVSAVLNLPIVDGDGAGRAIPSLPMLTFANPDNDYGILLSPCVLTSETPVPSGGAHLSFDCNEPASVDTLVRAIISAGAGFEQRSSLSCFAMKGHQIKQPDVMVHNTLTRARDLGRAIRKSSNPIQTIKALPSAQLICEGSIKQVVSTTRDGFDWIDVHIVDDDNNEFVVVAKNENMMVWSSKEGSPLVLAPDLICYIQPDGTVLSNSEITAHFDKNQNPMPIALFSLDAPKALTSEWYHKQFGEVFRSYGYYGNYHKPFVGELESQVAGIDDEKGLLEADA